MQKSPLKDSSKSQIAYFDFESLLIRRFWEMTRVWLECQKNDSSSALKCQFEVNNEAIDEVTEKLQPSSLVTYTGFYWRQSLGAEQAVMIVHERALRDEKITRLTTKKSRSFSYRLLA